MLQKRTVIILTKSLTKYILTVLAVLIYSFLINNQLFKEGFKSAILFCIVFILPLLFSLFIFFVYNSKSKYKFSSILVFTTCVMLLLSYFNHQEKIFILELYYYLAY
jgi:hypothetical protein